LNKTKRKSPGKTLQSREFQRVPRADEEPEVDFTGSLVDADMAAYSKWIYLNRLAGTDSAGFVAFHSGRRQAFASGPGLRRGTFFNQAISQSKLLSLIP
jgi:hypothetical protein